MCITPSCFAISRKSEGALLNRWVDVREITFRSAILARRVRISSWMPSAKYALSGSRLRLSNGRTATDFSGIAGVATVEDSEAVEAVIDLAADALRHGCRIQ